MLLYRILITLLAPLILLALLGRVVRGQESLKDFGERLGFWRKSPKGHVIWIHGASNGELTAARPLIESLALRHAEATLLITCNTVAAKKMLRSWGLNRLDARLAPIDLRWLYRLLMARISVAQFILIEADFWPNRILVAKHKSIPIALIAGRISEKSAQGWARFTGLAAQVFSAFDVICTQDDASEKRLLSLGAKQIAFGPQLSLKSLYQGELVTTDHHTRKDFWLAASTHEGEDEVLLAAHKEALKALPKLRMILAPRHPKRADQIAKIAQQTGLTATLRSHGGTLEDQSDVYIADTLGEMSLWYRAAGVCFVAGSLVPKGGHTPFEPAFNDCALLHGPHFESFAEKYDALLDLSGSVLCTSASQIADALIALQDPALAGKLRTNARGALEGTLDVNAVLDAINLPLKT